MSSIVAYVEILTGDFPLYEGDVRLKHRDIGDVFTLPDAYAPVYLTDKPSVGEYQAAVYGTPILSQGKWYTTWEIVNITPEFEFTNTDGTIRRKPFKETLWVNNEVYREAISVVTQSGKSILNELKQKFPDCEAGDNPLECIGHTPAGVRPPYDNPTISWYTWKHPPQNVLDDYKVSETEFFTWYGKKFDMTTGQEALKITHVGPAPQPVGLPSGARHGYGKIYYKDGSCESVIDYYVECTEGEFRQFTDAHNKTFPLNDPSQHDVLGYGVVYDINTLDILLVKAYTTTPVTMID